jgi:hypothetical protein
MRSILVMSRSSPMPVEMLAYKTLALETDNMRILEARTYHDRDWMDWMNVALGKETRSWTRVTSTLFAS